MKIEITMDEILEDLCHNGLPPGRWNVPAVDQRDQPLAAATLHEAGELVGDSIV